MIEGSPCASGGRVYDLEDDKSAPPRHLCPRRQHLPQSYEGSLLLDAVRSGGCLRLGLMGVQGLDREQLRQALGDSIPDHLLADLGDFAEAGVLAGIAKARARQPSTNSA